MDGSKSVRTEYSHTSRHPCMKEKSRQKPWCPGNRSFLEEKIPAEDHRGVEVKASPVLLLIESLPGGNEQLLVFVLKN